GKGAEASKDVFAELAVNAILAVVDEENGKYKADIEDIKIEKKVGGSVEASELIEGMVIDKERAHTNMPKNVHGARILLLSEALEIKKTEVKAEISIKSPDQLQLFLDQEEQMLHDMVSKVVDSGANVVFVEKGIDDIAQHYLAKAGIYAARRVKKSDMEKLARATGSKIMTGLKEISKSDLGKADLVEEKKIGEEAMTYRSEE
ncbi:MAG: TCP-1/cpn60 chaperonin family protein, partial [Candidatus Methanoperedens sp.]|nr:TCP-1/cpn60 chaperonin family protein [Candidatus Methanoperedens sp.]